MTPSKRRRQFRLARIATSAVRTSTSLSAPGARILPLEIHITGHRLASSSNQPLELSQMASSWVGLINLSEGPVHWGCP